MIEKKPERGHHHICTRNLTLFRCLSAIGVSIRKDDPVTKLVVKDDDGNEVVQCTFWMTDSEEFSSETVFSLMDAFYKFVSNGEKTLSENHPLYYAVAAVLNGNVVLDWIKRATPFVMKECGRQTLLMPQKPSPELERILRNHRIIA
jgi:hypothetical protein